VSSRLLDRQKESFDSLVDEGVYSVDFDHAPPAKAFVSDTLQRIALELKGRSPVNVLDCGCGTGAWLAFIHAGLLQAGIADQRLCGFDLSGRMVDVARERLQGVARPADIRSGNVLERQSYAFSGLDSGFDLIFTYDVVQQLPRARQLEACRTIAGALSPGGIALIFDNDADTSFGRRMAVRKFLTRYCGLRLVPAYYCNASYPPLERIRRRIDGDPGLAVDIHLREDGIKRVMIVRREGPSAGPAGTLAS